MGLMRRLGLAARYGRYLRDFRRYGRLAAAQGRELPRWRERWACVGDALAQTPFDPHYVYHVGWAARVLAQVRPARHVDIGSSLYFAVTVSAFVPVDFYDVRPAAIQMPGLNAQPGNLLALPLADRSVASLSCMHVVEHIGLGRYGDPLDPDGDRKALAELSRVLAPGGSLLLVVPTGQGRVCFNAHRVYRYRQITAWLSDLALEHMALLPDDTRQGLIVPADEVLADRQEYGCGCYWFRRRGC